MAVFTTIPRAKGKPHRSAKQRELGQFLTPSGIATFMAGLFSRKQMNVRLLEAGAGTGTLIQAYVEMRCVAAPLPSSIQVVAYELDPCVLPMLQQTLNECHALCRNHNITFFAEIRNEDFIESAVEQISVNRPHISRAPFNVVFLNPPYRKINSGSRTRLLLRSAGVETSNLYTAFLALAAQLLEPDGELVSITPRSFTNGPYFRPFRELFLQLMSLRQLHLFESRSTAFRTDKVLQENIVIHAIRGSSQSRTVILSTSNGDPESLVSHECPHDQIINPNDAEKFIHFVTNSRNPVAHDMISSLRTTLDELGINVSTGRVVDFRSREFLRQLPAENTVPLIYPCHFAGAKVKWPRLPVRKPNAIVDCDETASVLIPSGLYVLVKRLSAKEERRRVVACLYDPRHLKARRVGFENHLNYFHCQGRGLTIKLAKGLLLFLNSTALDSHFREFNGHTQVNATDLRTIRYPSRSQLELLGGSLGDQLPSQEEIDALLYRVLHQGTTCKQLLLGT